MENARSWRLRPQRYRLEGRRCTACREIHFPPRALCPACRSEALEAHLLAGRGTLYSYTVLHDVPERFAAQAPYAVGMIDLEEGIRLTAPLTDVEPAALEIGLPVEMVLRRLATDGEEGPILYGYKFRPRLLSDPD